MKASLLAFLIAWPASAAPRDLTRDSVSPRETREVRPDRLEGETRPAALDDLSEPTLPLDPAEGLAAIQADAPVGPPLDVRGAARRALLAPGGAPSTAEPSDGAHERVAEKLAGLFDGLGPFSADDRSLLNDAVYVAFLAHHADRRKFNVDRMPYMRHVGGAVGTLVNEFGIRDARSIAVMLLHDVREDHPDIWEAERGRFDEQVQRGVAFLDKGKDPDASIRRLMRDGTREFVLAKLSDRINNLRGVRFNLEEPRDDAARLKILQFAQKQFEKTQETLLPLIERSSLLLERDREIFYAAVLAEIRRIRTSTPQADFLESLEKRLSERRASFDKGLLPAGPDDPDFEVSLGREQSIAMSRMFYTLTSLDGVRRGAVPASPSRRDPDYWYHWKRDAGIVMTSVARIHRASLLRSQAAQTADEKHSAEKWRSWTERLLFDYASFARDIQLLRTAWDLGEVKTYLDGSAFTGPWARPQNDGPALAAISLTYWAETLLREGKIEAVRSLYDGNLPARTVIKADLEYVAHHWREIDADPWEEVYGRHFFNRMVQRKALIDGARLARTLGDDGAAAFYEQQARQMRSDIEGHWDDSKGYLIATKDVQGWDRGKTSGLDTQVLLGAIYGDAGDGFFSPTDSRILATAYHLHQRFKDLYPINRRPEIPGVAIGRYPEDEFLGGNPWVIATNALAQVHYLAGARFLRDGRISIGYVNYRFFRNLPIADPDRILPPMEVPAGSPLFNEIIAALQSAGDSYLARVRFHANPDGSLSEQMDKNSGFMLGARDLSWNYETYLTAMEARRGFIDALRASGRLP